MDETRLVFGETMGVLNSKRSRWSRAEKWLFFLTPLLLVLPLGVQRWQQTRAAQKLVVVPQKLGHTGFANSVAFSPDSSRLVTAGGQLQTGSEVRAWNLASLDKKAVQFVGAGASVMSLDAQFSPDGTRVLGIKGDGVAEQWSWPGGNWLGALNVTGPVGAPRQSRAVTPNGRPGVTLWRVSGSLGRLMTADYSPDGKTIVTGGYMSSTKGVWDANTGALLRKYTSDLEPIAGVRFAPRGQRFLTVSAATYREAPQFSNGDPYNKPGHNGIVEFWDATTGARGAKLPGSKVIFAAWSPNGKSLALLRTTGTMKRGVTDARGQYSVMEVPTTDTEIWSVSWKKDLNARKTAGWSNADALVSALAWSPNGQKLAGHVFGEGARIWNRKGAEFARLAFQKPALTGGGAPMPRTVAWSPNGRWIAAVNGADIELWKAPK